MQHLFERNIKLFSSGLTAVQTSFEEVKEFLEGGPHYFRMESFEYHVFNDSAILKESVGASMDKASCTRE